LIQTFLKSERAIFAVISFSVFQYQKAVTSGLQDHNNSSCFQFERKNQFGQ